MKTILTGIVCLLVGLVAGRFLPTVLQPDGEVLRVGTKSGQTQEVADNPATERFGSAHWQKRQTMMANSGLTELPQDENIVAVPTSLIRELSFSAGTRSIGQNLFSSDGKIEEILQITDQEKAAMQTAWRQSRQKIYALEARASKSESMEDGSVKITVPDITNRMDSLADGFQSKVKNTLGENRGDIFIAMKQVDRILAPPAGERTYKVKVEAAGDGHWRYHMTLESDEGSRVWVAENVPDEIRHLTDAARILPRMNSTSDENGKE